MPSEFFNALVREVKKLPSDWSLGAANGNKGIIYENWQNIHLKLNDFELAARNGSFPRAICKLSNNKHYEFPAEKCQAVSVLCGNPSNGLLFLDHDGASCDPLIKEKSGLSLDEALPRTPKVTSGKPGRYQSIYRVPEGRRSDLKTTKIQTGVIGPDGKEEALELRWDGAQSVVLGKHPETGSYKWIVSPQEARIAEAPPWMLALMKKTSSRSSAANYGSKPAKNITDDTVSLLSCCAPKTRDAINGKYSGGRNDTGIAIANDLIGTAHYLVAIGQSYEGDPEAIFFDWCSSCGLDKDNPPGQPDRIWNSAQRKDPKPSLQPEQIEGCIYHYNRRKKANTNNNKYNQKTRKFQTNNNTEGSEPEPTEEESIRLLLEKYKEEQDPFKKVIIENELKGFYQLYGYRLNDLLDVLDGISPSKLESLEDINTSVFTEIEERSETGVVPGYFTGFDQLDRYCNGLQRGDLIILAARPSMGKTSLAGNIACNIARNYETHVAIFSLEMSNEQLYYRFLSTFSGITTQQLKSGHVSQKWNEILIATAQLSSLNIHIDDTAEITPIDIKKKLIELKAQVGDIGLIIIDYLQLMSSGFNFHGNQNLEMSSITRSLKILARIIDAPIICLSQLSRAVEQRNDKRPIMSDLRDSGAIEQDADLIWMLYREEYYNRETANTGIVEVNTVKNRNGPTGLSRLNYEGSILRFSNLGVL